MQMQGFTFSGLETHAHAQTGFAVDEIIISQAWNAKEKGVQSAQGRTFPRLVGAVDQMRPIALEFENPVGKRSEGQQFESADNHCPPSLPRSSCNSMEPARWIS